MAEPYVHVIAALTTCSRIADVWTTYLVTPNLKIEANSLVRKLGWRFALLTILVGLVPYYSPPLGIVILTASFMVAASNASRIVTAKVLGEEELAALMLRVIVETPPWPGLLYLVLPAIFVAVLGASLLFFYPAPQHWGYYFALGMLSYAFAMFVWYPVHYFRIRKHAGKTPGHGRAGRKRHKRG